MSLYKIKNGNDYLYFVLDTEHDTVIILDSASKQDAQHICALDFTHKEIYKMLLSNSGKDISLKDFNDKVYHGAMTVENIQKRVTEVFTSSGLLKKAGFILHENREYYVKYDRSRQTYSLPFLERCDQETIVGLDGTETSASANTQIIANAQLIIDGGSDADRRNLCMSLIESPDFTDLINTCISHMKNNNEKSKLLLSLAEKGFADSDFFQNILLSINNGVYQEKAIWLCIQIDKPEKIEQMFSLITHNVYKYNCLIKIYYYSIDLFKRLYKNGHCFTNNAYAKKMLEWLSFRNFDV